MDTLRQTGKKGNKDTYNEKEKGSWKHYGETRKNGYTDTKKRKEKS